MNQVLLQLAKSGNKKQFFTTYKSLFGGTDTDAGLSYNAYIAHIRGGITSGGGGSPILPSGGDSSFGGNFLSNALSGFNKVVKDVGRITENFYRTQFGQERTIGGPDNNVGQKILDLIQSGGFNPAKLLSGGLGLIQDEIIEQLTRESELKSEINSKTTLTLQLSKDLREDILESSISAAKFGYSIKEVGDLYVGLSEKSGRYALINRETMELAAPVARSLSMSMYELSETINEFEKVGKGANDTLETIFDVEKRSMVLGLNGKKIVTDLQTNIGKLNEYGFKNGIRGLEEMTRRATEFRMSMEETFKIADKVMNPDSALELTANLQVLGGAIGDFNDPLKLMYMATNNVEGLQDALIEAAGSLTTYNQEQGRFEITGVNLRRAKEMATQLGVSYQELAKGAVAAAERSAGASELMMSGLRMNDDEKELLLNLSRMEKGEMVIKIPETLSDQFGLKTEIKLSEMTEGLKQKLVENAKAIKDMTPEDMAMKQLTATQQMAGYLQTIAAWGQRRGVQVMRGVLKGTGAEETMINQYEKIAKKSLELTSQPTDTQLVKRTEMVTKGTIEQYVKEPGRDISTFYNNLSWDNLWNGKSWEDVKEIFQNKTNDETSKKLLVELEKLNLYLSNKKPNKSQQLLINKLDKNGYFDIND